MVKLEDNLYVAETVYYTHFKGSYSNIKDDLIQAGYIEIYEKIERFDSSRARLFDYLYACVKQSMIRFIQSWYKTRSKKKMAYVELDAAASVGTYTDESSAYLRDCFYYLNDEQYRILLLIDNYNYKEIASILGCSTKTITRKTQQIKLLIKENEQWN